MSLIRRLPLVIHVLVLLSILAACLAQDSIVMLLVAGGAAAASRLVTEGPRGVHLGRRDSLLLTGVVVLGVVGWLLAHPTADDAVHALGQFAVWITVLKMYEERTLEIEAERLILSVLLMVLAAMDAFDLLFGFILAVWVLLAVVAILLFQLHYGAELGGWSHRSDQIEEAEEPTIGKNVRNHFRRMILAVVGSVAVVAAAVFLLFPRGVSEQLATAAAARIAKSSEGLDSEVTLISGTRIVESDDVVGRVAVSRTEEAPRGSLGRLYLRTATASVYAGSGRWTPSQRLSLRRVDLEPGEVAQLDFAEGAATEVVRIDLDKPLKFLPTPDGAIDLRSSTAMDIEVFRWRQVVGVAEESAVSLQMRSSGGRARAEGPWITGGAVPAAAERVATEVLAARNVPLEQPRTAQAASQWRLQACTALIGYLQSGRFAYTLDLSRIGRTAEVRRLDPVERFLTVEPIGHCEYFAAAFVAMAQSIGLQARIVTGFMVTPESENFSQYTIRDRDAHAWAEVRIDRDRWMQFDPTVARRIERELEAGGMLASLRNLYHRVESWWRLHILGFDAELQNALAEQVFEGDAGTIERLRGWLVGVSHQIDVAFGFRRLGSIYIVGLLLIVTATVLVVWLAWRGRRRLWRRLHLGRRKRTPGVRRAAGNYGELLRILRRHGMAKPEHVPPLAWCGEVGRRCPAAGPVAARIVEHFYVARFGGVAAETAVAAEVKRDLAALKTILRPGG
ncbi:MAG: transglutaminase-like domain-containing protein [Phycisphaerales bacterium]|jgi:hypothetical protein|nr:transglutaminase-like domain-containing protein [Phycisphaerales bacterium]